MKKLVLLVTLCLGLNVSLLSAELKSAKELKNISVKATKQAISDFKKESKSKKAYDETKSLIANQLNKIAKEGFYDIVYVQVDDGTLYNSLSKKKKDILESILKKELVQLGYKVQSARYDSIMLHWAITWG